MNHENLVFLGTSHIAKQSLEDVKGYIEKEKPDIIAIELDEKRLRALMKKTKIKADLRSIRRIGLKGFLFSLFGAWAERKLGRLVGVAPGSEMRQAIKIAKKKEIELALIDQDIEITLQRLSNVITWKEKLNFLADMLKAIFIRKKEIDFDLTTVPDKDIINKLLSKLKERYPNLYKVLIEERNLAIAENLKNLMSRSRNKKILVILGAGHIDGIIKILGKEEQEIKYTLSFG